MPKYSKKVTEIRNLIKPTILQLLKSKPRTIEFIYNKTSNKFPHKCNNDIKCECGNKIRKSPEWKHQVRWAIQDLKYHGKIKYNKETKLCSQINLDKEKFEDF